MSWRDELRRVTLSDGRRLVGASFRGVPFLVAAAERTGGRRTVVHEFPLRDDPFVEDLGRHSRAFRVEGYVLGPDYLAQRDALLAALEDTADAGELVHPYYGVKRAICSTLSTRETVAEGGMATFAIDFTEAPAQSFAPTQEIDLASNVSASADAATAAAADELAANYSVTALPTFALASATAAIQAVTAALRASLVPALRDTQELAQLNAQLTLLEANASSLARTPAQILDTVRATITSLVTTAADFPGAVMNALIAAYAAKLPPLASATTPTRAQERANQTALYTALRQTLAIEAARLAPSVPFDSFDAAVAARTAIAGELDAEATFAGDESYPALVQLRADLVAGVPGDPDLARLVTITRRVSIPSLLLAYQLYGAADKELDIVARNDIRNPVFTAGDLVVLSSV